MVFAAHQLQEKCQEQNPNLCMTSTDLTKAFDTVSREGLWKIMAKFGCPEKFITMVWHFHDGTLTCPMDDGESAEPFPVTSGVKQGCVLIPALFSMMFSAMLINAFCDCDTRIGIRYWTDSKLFNLRRQQAKMKVQEVTVHDLLFSDDCSLNAISESDIQWSLDYFSSDCDNFGGLCANVGDCRGISQQTKLKVYKAIVLPTLMHACKTWMVNRCHAMKLNHFHTGCLRKRMRIRWQDKAPDAEVLIWAGISSIHTLLIKSQMRWAGHVTR
ncbi:uncharacterized protein LOC120401728 [Mauremys reevesii]|uniref:uncharacterized protein LOC120401728 n=1 Tax=Mauremys reevesii TaxID=260615 RepID=UPI00193FEC48|nr:uncharacterized protein LOC120401728 [Mauremys reevesii]